MELRLHSVDPPDIPVDMGITIQIPSTSSVGDVELFDQDELLMAIGPHIQAFDVSFQVDYEDGLVDVIYVFDCDILAYELIGI